jgi:hypothetical protein
MVLRSQPMLRPRDQRSGPGVPVPERPQVDQLALAQYSSAPCSVPGDMVVCLSRLRRLEEIMDCIEHPLVIVTR